MWIYIPSWNVPYLQSLISESSLYNPAKYVNSAVCLESNSRTSDYALKLKRRNVLEKCFERTWNCISNAVISHFWVKQQYWVENNIGWAFTLKLLLLCIIICAFGRHFHQSELNCIEGIHSISLCSPWESNP